MSKNHGKALLGLWEKRTEEIAHRKINRDPAKREAYKGSIPSVPPKPEKKYGGKGARDSKKRE